MNVMDEELAELRRRVDYLQRIANEVDAARDGETVKQLRGRIAHIPVVLGDPSTTQAAMGIR
jgi:hypothetical protein